MRSQQRSIPHRLTSRAGLIPLLVATAALGTSASAASSTMLARADLHRGEPAPQFTVRTLSGATYRLDEQEAKALVLVFGETGHERCDKAFKEVRAAVEQAGGPTNGVSWVVVLSKGSDPIALGFGQTVGDLPQVIHDVDRTIFGAYQVIVTPTAVVIDSRHRVVHVVSGVSPSFPDTVQDAISVAKGEMTFEQFDARLHPSASPQPTEARLKAERLVKLADHLLSKGMNALAQQKYLEAVEADPSFFEARMLVGLLLLSESEWEQAESQFRGAQAIKPASREAAACLAQAIASGGDDRLAEASSLVDNILEADDSIARAHFVRGLVLERQGDLKASLAEFKRAAQLLLEAERVPAVDNSQSNNPGDTN